LGRGHNSGKGVEREFAAKRRIFVQLAALKNVKDREMRRID
jgi:hypothetical protein